MYCSAEEVRLDTQVRPADLGFDDVAALDAWLEPRLDEVSDLIDNYTNRTWTAETVPDGIRGIAREMGHRVVSQALVTKQSPVIRLDDWKVQMVESQILTPSIRAALDLYVKRSTSFGMFRVRRADEMP